MAKNIFGENNIFRRIGRDIDQQGRLQGGVIQQVSDFINGTKPYIGGSLAPTVSNPFAEDPIVNFAKSNSSYSGSDGTIIVQLNNKLIVMGNVETFSHSIHREKVPVRTLGRSNPKGFTSGGRTVAGSIVFITFDRAPLWSVIKEINYVRNPTDRTTSPLPDQLPPLDLILLFQNEYGNKSLVRLYGVEFLDEGSVYSINDLYSECTMQYVARDMDQMVAYEELEEFKNLMFERQVRGQFIDNEYQGMLEYKNKVENQISEINAYIDQIDLELNRRMFAGVVTASISYWAERLPGFQSRDQLKSEKSKQLKLKNNLLNELEKINSMLASRQLVGTNANKGDDTGHTASERARQAPVTPR
jgi:hypothetical protein